MKGPVIGAKIQKLSFLLPKIGNAARWNSTFLMVKRHFEVKGVLLQPRWELIDDFNLDLVSNRWAKDLLKCMSGVEPVTKKLQVTWLPRLMFQVYSMLLWIDSGTTKPRQNTDADFLQASVLEPAVVKVQRRNKRKLNRDKWQSLEYFEEACESNMGTEGHCLSFPKRALKKQKKARFNS